MDLSSNKVRPTAPNQMPWIVITCGNKKNDPHGPSYVAEFFDARFPKSGSTLPRTDMPIEEGMPFTWDNYRLDTGIFQLLAPQKAGDDPIAAREHKSALRNFDTPKGFSIQCPQPVAYESRNGITTAQCKDQTFIKRQDWNEFGKVLLGNKVLVEGAAPFFISWESFMSRIHGIQAQRNTNQ
jgi:hypothetical protein